MIDKARVLVLILCVALVPSTSKPASIEESDDLIEVVVEQNGALGVGVGPSAGLKILSVCDTGKVNPDAVVDALQEAMSNADITFDPPTLEGILGIKLGESWKTQPELLSAEDIAQYNLDITTKEFKLSPEYNYQVAYSGKFDVSDGSRIRLWLHIELFKGRSYTERQSYGGPYAASVLRNRFAGRVLTRVKEYAECR